MPLNVRNVVISEEIFKDDYNPAVPISASDNKDRVLFLTSPLMKGEDVKKLQRALKFIEEEIDGIFGLNPI